MAPLRPAAIAPPRLPPRLTALTLDAVEDETTIGAALISGGRDAGRLASVTFEKCHLQRVSMQGVQLRAVSFRDCRLSHGNLSQAILERLHAQRLEIVHCRLTGAQALDAHLADLFCRDCQGQYLTFAGSELRNARFERCVLRDASFQNASLAGAVFHECDLTNADFGDAKLGGADIRGCTIDGLRIGLREVQGLIVDLLQASKILRGFGADVVVE